MNTIPRDLENAFKLYMQACASAADGGLWLFKTASGTGTLLSIRAGQSEDGEKAAQGTIICACFGEQVQQEIPRVNAWRAVMEITLRYPADSHTADTNAVISFSYIAAEISAALTQSDAVARINQAANGVEILGPPREGIAMESGIEDEARVYRWVLSLMVAATFHRPVL